MSRATPRTNGRSVGAYYYYYMHALPGAAPAPRRPCPVAVQCMLPHITTLWHGGIDRRAHCTVTTTDGKSYTSPSLPGYLPTSLPAWPLSPFLPFLGSSPTPAPSSDVAFATGDGEDESPYYATNWTLTSGCETAGSGQLRMGECKTVQWECEI